MFESHFWDAGYACLRVGEALDVPHNHTPRSLGLWTRQRMEREFLKIGRLLVPDRRDWTSAGQVLAKVGQKHGFNLVGRARLTNDAVIAMSVASHGFTIQTKNPGDFQLIAEFRPFDWETV